MKTEKYLTKTSKRARKSVTCSSKIDARYKAALAAAEDVGLGAYNLSSWFEVQLILFTKDIEEDVREVRASQKEHI